MNMMTIKIDLSKLSHKVMEKNGEKYLVLPVKANHLFNSEKGAVYLDVMAFELKDPKYNDTHMLKQSLPKDVRDKMTKEEQHAQPILGGLNAKFGGNSAPSAPAAPVDLGADDLPF